MNSFYAITIQAFMITSETNSLSPHIKLKDKKHRRITFFLKNGVAFMQLPHGR